MTVIRLLVSAFIVALIVISAAGWVWNGQHQGLSAMVWGRAALVACIAAGVVGLVAIWRTRSLRPERGRP
jgi:hypothetical protein